VNRKIHNWSAGVVSTGEHIPDPNQTLIRALALAHRATTALREGIPLRQISAKEKCSDSYIRTRSQLAFLAPKIQIAILVGQQPAELTLEKIIRKPIPLDWDQQLASFGFDDR
jgi:hypothetical protein